jgi:hypothetical protein
MVGNNPHLPMPNTAGTPPGGSQAMSSDGSDVACAVGNLLGPRGQKPKAERVLAVYWDLHKERLQPLYQNAESPSGSHHIGDWNVFLRNEWAKEPLEVQHVVEEERDRRHFVNVDKWSSSGLQPLKAETQHR